MRHNVIDIWDQVLNLCFRLFKHRMIFKGLCNFWSPVFVVIFALFSLFKIRLIDFDATKFQFYSDFLFIVATLVIGKRCSVAFCRFFM